jgi:hypothetical protein
MESMKKTRWMILAAMVSSLSLAAGCAADDATSDTAGDEEGATTDDITSTANISEVKRQSIGNCWLYATASWVESLEKAASKTEDNYSESYWTFWHWFEQLANGYGAPTEISTGGSYMTAAGLIDRYGMMLEKDFIPEEASSEMSSRQKSALDAMNGWLKGGGLTAAGAPKKGTQEYRGYILKQLEKAWGLSADRAAKIEKVFGVNVTKTVDKSYGARKPGSEVVRAKDVLAAIPDMAQSTAAKTVINPKLTIQDAIGTGSSYYRSGKNAWHEVTYPSTASERRGFYQEIQRSLHDGVPVVSSWFVDFNALTADAHFSKKALDAKGPGHQGGHMTLLVDYTAKTSDGKTYAAGQTVTDATTLTKLLDAKTEILSVRMKNSWGAYRPDRWASAQLPGYHDLDSDYLNGPVKRCKEVNGVTDTKNCQEDTGMQDVVLAPTYGKN